MTSSARSVSYTAFAQQAEQTTHRQHVNRAPTQQEVIAIARRFYLARSTGDVDALKSIYLFATRDDANQFDRVGKVWSAFRRGLGARKTVKDNTIQLIMITHPADMRSGDYWFLVPAAHGTQAPYRLSIVVKNNKVYVPYDPLDRDYIQYDENMTSVTMDADGTKSYGGIDPVGLTTLRLRSNINKWKNANFSQLAVMTKEYRERWKEYANVYDFIKQKKLPSIVITGDGQVIRGDATGRRQFCLEYVKKLNAMSDRAIRDELIIDWQNELRSMAHR